jgi:peptidoglycan hydrolase-like protein with peptidoglycan-binding domain
MLRRIFEALFKWISPKKPLPAPKKWERGKQDQEVKEVQKKLLNLGLEFEGGSDGLLGEHTENAIEEFKQEHEIEEDGIGEQTLQALERAYQELKIPDNLILRVGDDDEDFRDDEDPENDEQVSDFQKKLIALGYDLPRFGADGSFDDESLVATKAFQDENPTLVAGEDAFRDQGVGPKTFAAVMAAKVPPPEPDIPPKPFTELEGAEDIRHTHTLKKGRGTRKLSEITGVTLHQTGCLLSRWKNVACHIGIKRDGTIVFVNDFIHKVWHGNGFNGETIGIEIEGHFAGLEEYNEKTGEWVPDLKTYWRPKGSTRQPISINEAQVEACKRVIRWIKQVIEAAGGKLKYLVAHRQSSPSRTSDPGEKAWKLIALPLMIELGLTDGGPDYYILDSKGRAGKPIPARWNPLHSSVAYRAKTTTKGRRKKGPSLG